MIIPIMSIVLLTLGLICKKDKRMFYILWVFMIIIIIMNTYNADWDAYEFMYSLINSIDRCLLTDVGYGILNYIANIWLHLNFFQFRALFTLSGMLILRKTILSESPYPTLVLVLYFIAPFFPNDIVQIRNFMSQVLLTFFLTKWIDSEKKKLIYFVLAIGLAITMHASAAYFAVFILIYFIKDDKKLYLGVAIGALLVGGLPTILNRIPFISVEKINFYLGSMSRSIDVRGFIIICVFLVQLSVLYIIRKCAEKSVNCRFKIWADIVYKMNILCIPACIIMAVWTFNFYRVPRNLLILNYIVYSMYLKEEKKQSIINFITLIMIMCGVCWSALNSFSQWSVIWSNNALITW